MSLLNNFAVVWGALEILLFAGQIFGWSSLAYVFKYDGYFDDLCAVGDRDFPVNTSIVVGGAVFETVTGSGRDAVTFPAAATGNGPRNGIHNSSDDLSYAGQTDSTQTTFKGCAAVDERFNLIYTLAVVVAGVIVFLTGYLMDRFGTRRCRCGGILFFLCCVFYIIGALLVAFSTKATPLILVPAMILLATGGYVFLMTNLQIGNLIPQKKSTIISLYCGAYDSSAFSMVLVKLAYDAGISVKISFLVIICIFMGPVISTFWFMPRLRIPFPPPEGYHLNFGCDTAAPPSTGTADEIGSTEESGKEELVGEKRAAQNDDDLSFKSIATSRLFLSDVFWLTCQRFQSWSFIGRLNPTLYRLANNDKAIVSSYLSVYASMQFVGIFLAPLSGRLMDRKSSDDAPPAIKKIERLEVCTTSFVIDTTLGLILAVVVFIPILEVQYAAFVLHVVHRALLYGPNSAFIAQVFGPKHFGKLFGLAMSSSAAFSLLQYPLFVLVRGPLGGDPLLFNMVVLVLMVVSFVHPVYMWRRCRADRRAFQAEEAGQPLKTSDAKL